MISSYNLPQQIFVSGLACAAELERRALGPVRLYCAGRAGPAIRFRPPKHEVPTASHCIVNSWYQWSPNSAFKEIWAYSPIEWARWFAKNFATPKDIERTESWQHLRQAYSRLNIKIYEIWCLTMFYPDIIWHPPESCWISTKTQENWSSYPMAKTMGSWNPLPKPKGLICSWGTVWQMPLFSQWTATSMCWARTAIRFGLRSPAWSTKVLQMRVVDGWFGEFFISHGVCCHICAVYCTHFISCICYLAYLIIWFL